jgi:hypothetical protein
VYACSSGSSSESGKARSRAARQRLQHVFKRRCHACAAQVTDMIAEGYPAQQVLLQLQALVVPGAVTGAAVADADDTASLSDTTRAKVGWCAGA